MISRRGSPRGALADATAVDFHEEVGDPVQMSALTIRWLKIPTALMCALSILAWSLSAAADDFAAASLIIPMDTTYQDTGMLRAYGLIYELLRNGVPVRWVIKTGKTFQGVDFTASATDHQTNAAIVAHGYRGGPFVIDAADA